MDLWGHLTEADVLPAFTPPTFTQTVSDTLGNLGDPTDGFDSQLAQANSDLDSIGNLIDLLDGPVDSLLGFADGVDDNPLAQSTSLLQQNIASASADRDAFVQLVAPNQAPPPNTGGAPSAPATGNVPSPTPAAAAACGQGSFLTINATASVGQLWFGGISIPQSPFDVAATVIGSRIVPSTDTQYFNLTSLINVPVGFDGPYNVANMSGNFPDPGTYVCQVELDFQLSGGQGTGSLTVCVVVTVS